MPTELIQNGGFDDGCDDWSCYSVTCSGGKATWVDPETNGFLYQHVDISDWRGIWKISFDVLEFDADEGAEISASFSEFAHPGEGAVGKFTFWEGSVGSSTPRVFISSLGEGDIHSLVIDNVSVVEYSPSITEIKPSYGPEAGGTVVTLTGRDLDFCDRVTVDGVDGTIVDVTPTAITFITPPSSTPGNKEVNLWHDEKWEGRYKTYFRYGTGTQVPLLKLDGDGKVQLASSGGIKKLQLANGPPCGRCLDYQPAELTVSLDEFVNCSGCIACQAGSPAYLRCVNYQRDDVWHGSSCRSEAWVPHGSFKVEGVAEALNGQSFDLDHWYGCRYRAEIDIDVAVTFYVNAICDEALGWHVREYQFTKLYVYAEDVGVDEQTGNRRIKIDVTIRGNPDPDYYYGWDPSVNCELSVFSGYITYNDYLGSDPWDGDGYAYSIDDLMVNGEFAYRCIKGHTSSSSSEPEVGQDWEDYWVYAREECFENSDDAYNEHAACCDGLEGMTAWNGASHSYSKGDPASNIHNAYSPPEEVERYYVCSQDHTSSTDNEPGVGQSQASYWSQTAPSARPCGATGKASLTIKD